MWCTYHFCEHGYASGDLGDVLELEEVPLLENVLLRNAETAKVLQQSLGKN